MGNDLSRLVDGGRIQVGDELYHPKRSRTGGGIFTAHVVDGGIELDGEVYTSVSAAAQAVADHSVNGWKYWRLRSSKQTLDAIRRDAGVGAVR